MRTVGVVKVGVVGKMADFEKHVCGDEKEISQRMCSFVIDVANQAISRSGVFSVGLSGIIFRLSLFPDYMFSVFVLLFTYSACCHCSQLPQRVTP